MHPLQMIFIIMMGLIILFLVLKSIERVARWYIMSFSTKYQDEEDEETNAVAQTQTNDTNAIAIPQTLHNQSIVFDPAILELASLMNNPPAVVHAQIEVIARLCDATRKTKTGPVPILGETDAIKNGLQINPGSSNPKYAVAKTALAAFRTKPAPVFQSLDANHRAQPIKA